MDDGSDDGPFERCPVCDRPVVSLARHSCPDDTDKPNPPVAERERHADDDPRDSSRLVVLPSGKGNTTYHEIEFDTDQDGDRDAGSAETVCWHDPDLDAAAIKPQGMAAERGYCPCKSCRRIEQTQSSQGT